MRWFNRFLGKREDKLTEVKEERPLTVNFNEINELLNKELEKQLKPFEENVKKEFSGIQVVVDEFKNCLHELEEAKLEGELGSQQKHLLFTHRSNLVNKMNNMLNSFEFPVELGYESTINFYNSFSEALNYASTKAEKDFRHVNIFFKKEAKGILGHIKKLDYQSRSLGALIDVKEDFFTTVEDSFVHTKELQDMFVIVENNKKELKILEDKLRELKKLQKLMDEQIKSLLNSKDWITLIELTERRKNIENEMNEMKNGIIRTISNFEKLFRKFRKLLYDGKEQLENKAYIDYYINTPITSLESDEELKILYSILESIKKCILTNTIELQNNKREKALTQINDVLENNTLMSLVKKYENLKNEKNIVDDEINIISVVKEKEILGRKLEEIKREIEMTESKVDEINRNDKTLNDKMNKIKTTLENYLGKIINQKVNVAFF